MKEVEEYFDTIYCTYTFIHFRISEDIEYKVNFYTLFIQAVLNMHIYCHFNLYSVMSLLFYFGTFQKTFANYIVVLVIL